VARSARGIAVALAAPALAAGLAGCVTTQEKNSWLLLKNARQLASEDPVLVTAENPDVRVLGIHVVRGGRSTALAISLRNLGQQPLTDLPISVGVIAGHKPSYLNGRANIDYYDTHVPAIPAGATISWVLPDVKPGLSGHLFAKVGIAHTPASTTTLTLPRIAAAPVGVAVAGRVRVAVSNDSSLPQFGLQVYAVAVKRGAYVGAGRAALGTLDGRGRTTVAVSLAGDPAGATLELYAPPTIFK
jgi:hypothetical protein